LAVIATGLFVVAVLFGLVGLHVMLAQNQFRLDRLNSRADAEQARFERLRLQVDQLESPQRIIATAQQKLGLVTPGSVTYLTPSGPLPASVSPATAGGAGVAVPVSPPDWPIVKPHLAAQP
jgi:cell division protein FtsL